MKTRLILLIICIIMWIVSLVCLIYGIEKEELKYIIPRACNMFTFTLLGMINYDAIKNGNP